MNTNFITERFSEVQKEKDLRKKIRLIIKLLKTSQTSTYILVSSVIVTLSSLFSNVFSYLFQLFAGNYLTKENFAELTSLFALSGIIALVVSFLSNGIAKLVAEIKDEPTNKRISEFFYSLLKINLSLTIVISIFMYLFRNNFQEYLNINDVKVINVFILAVAAAIINSGFGPFLQGLQKFKSHSIYTFLTSFTKFLVMVVVIYFSLRLKDIFWGLAITTIIMALIGFIMIINNISHNINYFNRSDIKTLFTYSIGSLWTLLGLNLLQNTDILMAKHYFDAELAGTYSGISIIGKIIFYIASPVTIVMLPICSEYYKNNKNLVKPFVISLLLTLAAAFSTFIIFWLFPGFVIKSLFGVRYANATEYLPLYSFFILLYSLATFLGFFSISISKFKIGSISLIGALIQYIGISMFHNNIKDIVTVSIISTSLVLFAYIIFLLKKIDTSN